MFPERSSPAASLIVLLFVVLALTASGALYAEEKQDRHRVPYALEAAETASQQYLPVVFIPGDPRAPLPPPEARSVTPPESFATIRAKLQAQGQELAFSKIGFHTGVGGDVAGLKEWMDELDASGVPFFLKSVDDPGLLNYAQGLAKASGVPHTLVWRRASGPGYDLPNYDLSPKEAAAGHWQYHLEAFPSDLDPSMVWIETVNEVDKNRSEWLAEFALETAKLAIADGYRWAAFGWSSGEPEPYHWKSPAMLEFLEFAADHPNQVAIALHEYSFSLGDDDHPIAVANIYPYLVGRFQKLYQICDQHGIGRPTVLITEWGWQATEVPEPSKAMDDIAWAAWLYAAYPQVKGAAIWYLGGQFGGIAGQAQKLIAPVSQYSQSNYFAIAPGEGRIDPDIFEPQ